MSDSRKRKRAVKTTTSSSSSKSKSSPSSLAEAYDQSVRPYIDLVDSLRSSGVDKDVSLPSVVVIGDQSTGKSSVLEAMSGVQLPRGTGIVTRCALELRLKKLRGRDAGGQWKGQLRYVKPGEEPVIKNLANAEEVEEAVREAQNALAGKGKGISKDSKIELEVFSSNVPDLTLIDLPGITRVAAQGQPHNIGEQVKRLIKKHIGEEETIILCVIPCTSDIATTEALQFAQEVDPEGDRTLGVLTRADQTGPGEENNVIDIVQQRGDVQLKLGCTVVKCRSQKDVEERMPLEEALDIEENFFRQHKVFQKLEPSTTGIRQLALKLTRQLVSHIQACLPNLLKDVERALIDTTGKLKKLGSPLPKDKQRYLTEALLKFSKTLTAASRGDSFLQEINDHGHLFMKNVRSCFGKFANSIKLLCPDDCDLKKIKRQIDDRRGRELPGFENYGVFEWIARNTVKKFEKPALECLNSVKRLVEELYLELAADQLERFANLKEKVITHVGSLFRRSCGTAAQAIDTMMSMEQWIYTSDPVYQSILSDIKIDKATSTVDMMQIANPSPSSGAPASQTKFLLRAATTAVTRDRDDATKWSAKQLLEKLRGYFMVVSLRLGDHLPMTIMLHLLTNFVQAVEAGLISKFMGRAKRRKLSEDERSVNDEESDEEDEELTAEELLQEDGEIAFQRNNLELKKRRLLDAERKLKAFTIKRKREDHKTTDRDE